MGLWILESGKLWFPVLIAAGWHMWLRLTAELEEMGGRDGGDSKRGADTHMVLDASGAP